MAQHVKILGILHICFSALGMLAGVIILVVFGSLALVGAANQTDDRFVALPVLGGIGGLIFIFILVLSLPGLIAGIGLIKLKSWARILGIVISALDLISIPFGTALGIYGLWVLLQNETEVLFRVQPPMPMRPPTY
ncbi:MAG TPA: hypothetical protein VKU01_24330 [Bryobacteraceae bacterium]|nr:hypothetical protein [Bryobacteraceae bacterium]